MPLQNSSIVSAQNNQSTTVKTNSVYGIVYDVILDETNKFYKARSLNASHIGAAIIILPGSSNINEEDMRIILPYDKNFKALPIKNEKVEIVSTSGALYYKRNGADLTPNVDTPVTTLSTQFVSKSTNGVNKDDYGMVEQTGIANKSADPSNDYDNYGKYFKYTNGIRKLKLYEGDMVVESRFGQSIRFSGYNNDTKDFSPTILIRNGQHYDGSDSVSIEENINKDGSIIAMTSNRYVMPFQPGVIGESNTGDFATKPIAFGKYPTELSGNQILINSGRIIISSKTDEIIFYSKKDYGFISDGTLSIDNLGGIIANVNDTIDITTNNKDININTGNGKINLGNKTLHPLIKGDTLVELLDKLLTAINAQTFLTPSGPTAVGPVNKADFNQIQSELKTALSDYNKTS